MIDLEYTCRKKVTVREPADFLNKRKPVVAVTLVAAK